MTSPKRRYRVFQLNLSPHDHAERCSTLTGWSNRTYSGNSTVRYKDTVNNDQCREWWRKHFEWVFRRIEKSYPSWRSNQPDASCMSDHRDCPICHLPKINRNKVIKTVIKLDTYTFYQNLRKGTFKIKKYNVKPIFAFPEL